MADTKETKDIGARRNSAQAWRFIKERYPATNLETLTDEELAQFGREHNINPSTLLEYRSDDRYLQEIFKEIPKEPSASESPVEQGLGGHGDGSGLAGAIGFASVLVPKNIDLLEDDPEFQRIEEDLKKKWLEKNNKENFQSKEGLDYLYGDLENPDAPNLKKQAEEAFREAKDKKGNPLYAKRLAKYDKKRDEVKKNPKDDPAIAYTLRSIAQHKNARLSLLKKTDPNANLDKSDAKKIEDRAWDRFVAINPQEAQGYKEKGDLALEAAIKSALARAKKKEELIQTIQPDLSRMPIITPQDAAIRVEIKPEQKIKKQEPAPQETKELQKQPEKQQQDRLDAMAERTQRAANIASFSEPASSFPPPQPPPSQSPQRQGPSSPDIPNFPLGRRPGLPRNPLGGVRTLGNAIKTLFRMPGFWYGVGIAVVLLSVVAITFFIGGPLGGKIETTVGTGTGSGGGLDYTIRIRDTSILPVAKESVSSAIIQEFPLAKLAYWDNIVSQAVANGWNPAFVLALWIEETGASHHTKINNGGSGVAPVAKGHLGCAPWEDQTIDESLQCVFKRFPLDKFPNEKFDDFMCIYGGDGFHPAPCVFEKANPQFPSRIKRYYQLLVPSGNGLTNISSIVPTGVGGERIASAAKQIAEQLVSSDDSATLRTKGWTCDVGGTFGKSFHCWEPEKMRRFDQGGNPGYLECTEFIWAVFEAAGFEEEIKLIKNHHAFQWVEFALKSSEAQKAFQIFYDATQLQPGDIISSGVGIGPDGLPWGHVAIVIERIDNVIVVAQASTSKSIETWAIDREGKLISPIQSPARAKDTIRGFFRLIGKKAS